MIPKIRHTLVNDHGVNNGGDFVLYWMIAQRRARYNFSLDAAIEYAQQLNKPLVVLEPLRLGYRWASARMHRFIMDGMADQKAAFNESPVKYYPYVELNKGDGQGLLEALARRACLIVTDEFPCFFLPRMVEAAGKKVGVQMIKVDGNGMLPLRAADKTYTTAYSFRRGLHKMLPAHLNDIPTHSPLDSLNLPALASDALQDIESRWPMVSDTLLEKGASLDGFAFECDVPISPIMGGAQAGRKRLQLFLDERIDAYHEKRNDIANDGASGLSPYLHFGQVGAHEVFDAVMRREGWSIEDLPEKATGKREGWWQVSAGAESFLDELITWREIGLNMSFREPDTYTKYESLPDFARKTLEEHLEDPRDYIYDLEAFERGQTHDELWNAAQMQLVQTGKMHNYIRMLWGKKIIEWTETPRDALEIMIELNNKYALDGRDPNSYSGIFWCLGRYDRGWTEREVFGKIRYMSSDSTRRKYKVTNYIKTYANGQNDLFG